MLPSKGKVISRSSVNHLLSDINIKENQERTRKAFTEKMEPIIGNYSNATCSHYDVDINKDDTYGSLFGDDIDAIDDYEIKYQELDENDNLINCPEIDECINDPHLRRKMINIST